MLLFIDESGDPGLKLQPGLSPWLVVAGVLFDTREDGVACRAVLQDLRQRHGGEEFHFTKNSKNVRRAVLEALADAPFRYYAVACDKSALPPGDWRKPVALRHALAAQLMALVSEQLVDCTVWFDTLGSKPADREYERNIRTAAGSLPDGSPRIKSCGSLDSRKELLIQVADYVCATVAASVHRSGKNSQYLRVLKRRRGDVLFWQ